MSIELALGAVLLLASLWMALSAVFPAGPQVRLVAGAGHVMSRGARGVFADPSTPADDDRGAPVPPSPPPPAPEAAGEIPDNAEAMAMLREVLAALDEVLMRLPQPRPSAPADRSVAAGVENRRPTAGPGMNGHTAGEATGVPLRTGLTVGGVAAASVPSSFRTAPASSRSPMLDRLFELCEEELGTGDDGFWPPSDADTTPPVETDPAGVRAHEGSPMKETPHAPRNGGPGLRPSGTTDGEEEMFVVAMDALAHALFDEDKVVREASMRAFEGIDADAVRQWATTRLSTGGPEDARAAAVLVETLNRDAVMLPLLEQACAAAGDDERQRAIGALATFTPDTETLARLVDKLDESARVQAVALLPRLLAGEALDHMIDVMAGDPSERARLAALEMLDAHGDARTALRVASRAVEHDSSPAVRVAATRMLGRVGAKDNGGLSPRGGGPDAAELPVLDDPDALWHFLVALQPVGDAVGIPDAARRDPELLLEVALRHADDSDPNARALALRAALAASEAGVAREDGVVMAVLALGDPEPQVRRAAVEVCRGDSGEWSTACRRLLADPDRVVRAKAAAALAENDDDEAAAALVVVLADPDEDIRGIAVSALRAHPSPALAGLVVRQLESERAREAAAELLVGMGDAGRHAVDEAFPSLSADARRAAGRVLVSFEGGVRRHLGDLTSLDPRVRLRAVRALGAVGGEPEVMEALLARLQDPVEEIRMEVVEAVARLGGPDLEPVLRRVLATEPVEAVAKVAERALAVAAPRGPG